MMSRRSIALGLVLSVTVTGGGCAANHDVSGPTAAARIKLVHASAAVGAVDVYVAGHRVISNVASGRSSSAVEVAPGTQHVTLRSGATVVGELDAALVAKQVTAILLTAQSAQATTAVPDTGLATANNRANIRLVNVVGTNTSSPTLLHVLVHAPGLGADSVPKLGLDTRTASHGPLMYWDPGSFRFVFVPQGSTTVLAEVAFDVAAGERRSVVLERQASGQYRASVVVEP